MRFYELHDGEAVSWHPTLSSVHAEGKKVVPVFRGALRVTEVEISTDKAGVLQLLTGGCPKEISRGRSWRLTSRGGLRRCQVDETGS